MGSIENIDQLETYIKDLGDEIVSVKKASEYLKLIEQFQSEIKNTSSSLNQSRDQLKLIQEIVESKLDLFQTITKNIEAKQQSHEQSLLKIIASLSDLKQHQEINEKETTIFFKEINDVVNQNHDVLTSEINRVQEEQNSFLTNMSKNNKMFFSINTVIGISVLGISIYLLIR